MNPEQIKSAFDVCIAYGDMIRFGTPYYTQLQQQKVAIATDAHMLLVVKNLSYLDGLEITEKPIDLDRIVPLDWQYPFELITKDLRKEIKKYVYTRVHEVECEDCAGEGWVEYEYEALNGETYTKYCTCPICDGSGTLLHEDKNDKPRLKSNQYIRILSGVYDVCVIEKVCRVLETLQIEKIPMNAEPKEGVVTSYPLFVANNDEITLVAMPCISEPIVSSKIKTEYNPIKSI
ncbi:MAG: hypothetical protein K6G73_12205 [Marinilabiliaceae bacterium]|nr:hypothetical protein [Marinilabiliaceae bacterium]